MPIECVLVVDDNPTNLKLIRVLLAGEGYDVRTALDAEEALAALATHRPRLILMDLQLPGMNGLDLTRKLKSEPGTKDIPIVAVTSYAMKGDDQRAREAGCDGYITKPIDIMALLRIVASYFADGAGREAVT